MTAGCSTLARIAGHASRAIGTRGIPKVWAQQRWPAVVLIAFAMALTIPAAARATGAANASPNAVTAAFLYNFARFAEWPALPPGGSIVICIVGDDDIAAAVAETVHGQTIGGHGLEVSQPEDSHTWRACHLLYVADRERRQFAVSKVGIVALPVLTVSDSKGFSQAGGVIERYIDDGRLRFAVNVDAAEHAGLRLSSRLLGLAKIVR
jgi:YfiR/HmsC-like